MIRPKNETEDLLLSITKNCETLIKQTHRKAEKTLVFKMTKPEKHFISIHQFKLKKIGFWDWLIWKYTIVFLT